MPLPTADLQRIADACVTLIKYYDLHEGRDVTDPVRAGLIETATLAHDALVARGVIEEESGS
jgi:hypothetical protein